MKRKYSASYASQKKLGRVQMSVSKQAREALDQVRKEIVSDPILTPSYSQAIIYIAKYWTTSNKLAKKYWEGSYKKSRLRK